MTAPETTSRYQARNSCEAICGIECELAGEEIVAICGDRDDQSSRGYGNAAVNGVPVRVEWAAGETADG